MSVEPTKETIEEFVTEARKMWAEELTESGESQHMFAMSKDGIRFLAEYQNIKDQLEERGFEVPQLVDGLSVELS